MSMIGHDARNREAEGRTPSRLGVDPDPATVVLDDLLADGQADTGTWIIGPSVQALKHDEDAIKKIT